MTPQILPLGQSNVQKSGCSPSTAELIDLLVLREELIDKCVGSRIWVVMKGEKGTFSPPTSRLDHSPNFRRGAWA